MGRDCSLIVDNVIVPHVGDVTVRQVTTTVDGTGYGHAVRSEIVTHRTYEVVVSVPDLLSAEMLRKKAWTSAKLQGLIELWLKDGLFEIRDTFSVGEISGDEPLDDVVHGRFEFLQWGWS